MMITKKFKKLNFIYIVPMIILLVIINIIDSYSFLYKIGNVSRDLSIQDIIIYIVYGINKNARVNLVDILRSSIPYLLIVLFSGVYLSDMLDDNKKYLHLIRYKNYKTWLKRNIDKLITLMTLVFIMYYVLLIVLSAIFIDNNHGFTEAFYMLNPFYNNSSSFTTLLIYQYLLSITSGVFVILLQLLLSLMFKDTHKSFILMSLIILILSFSGKYDIYSPFTLSKHNLINTNMSIHPLVTIILNIVISTVVYLFIIKRTKVVVRRDGI